MYPCQTCQSLWPFDTDEKNELGIFANFFELLLSIQLQSICRHAIDLKSWEANMKYWFQFKLGTMARAPVMATTIFCWFFSSYVCTTEKWFVRIETYKIDKLKDRYFWSTKNYFWSKVQNCDKKIKFSERHLYNSNY